MIFKILNNIITIFFQIKFKTGIFVFFLFRNIFTFFNFILFFLLFFLYMYVINFKTIEVYLINLCINNFDYKIYSGLKENEYYFWTVKEIFDFILNPELNIKKTNDLYDTYAIIKNNFIINHALLGLDEISKEDFDKLYTEFTKNIQNAMFDWYLDGIYNYELLKYCNNETFKIYLIWQEIIEEYNGDIDKHPLFLDRKFKGIIYYREWLDQLIYYDICSILKEIINNQVYIRTNILNYILNIGIINIYKFFLIIILCLIILHLFYSIKNILNDYIRNVNKELECGFLFFSMLLLLYNFYYFYNYLTNNIYQNIFNLEIIYFFIIFLVFNLIFLNNLVFSFLKKTKLNLNYNSRNKLFNMLLLLFFFMLIIYIYIYIDVFFNELYNSLLLNNLYLISDWLLYLKNNIFINFYNSCINKYIIDHLTFKNIINYFFNYLQNIVDDILYKLIKKK